MSTKKRRLLDDKTKNAVQSLFSLSQQNPYHSQKRHINTSNETPEQVVYRELNTLRQHPTFRRQQENIERLRKTEAEAQAIRNAEQVVKHQLDSIRQGYFLHERNYLASELIRNLKEAAELKTNRDIEHDYSELSDVRSTGSAPNSVLNSVVAPRASMNTDDHVEQINQASKLRKRYKDKRTDKWYVVLSDDGDPDPGNHAFMPARILSDVIRKKTSNESKRQNTGSGKRKKHTKKRKYKQK